MTLLSFAALAVFGLAVPLGASISTARTQQLWLARYVDTQMFAHLAEEAIATDNRRPLIEEVERYYELYAEHILVVDDAGVDIVNTGVDTDDPLVTAALVAARSNQHSRRPPPRLLTWDPDTMLIAWPIGSGLQVKGAVLMEASTVRAKQDIADRWAVIAVGAWTALALFTGLALILSRWVLRPLARLSGGVTMLTETLPKPRDDTQPASMAREYGGPPEVRELAQSFDAMVLAVSDSVDAQNQLVADTAHAIRNPLAALAIRLAALERVIPADAEQMFVRASYQVDRLSAVLDGLLRLAVAETPARFDSVQADSEWPSRCDAVRICADRIESWQLAFEQAGLALVAELPADVVEVQAPEDALEQVLDVALSNSCRYAGAGARTEVRVRVGRPWVTVSVIDNGVGVAEHELDKLTTRFYRASSATPGGSGLGLPIAAALVQRYQGEFTVATALPRGLDITVRLPMVTS